MSVSGWVMMGVSWGVVSVLCAVLIYLTLRVPRQQDDDEGAQDLDLS